MNKTLVVCAMLWWWCAGAAAQTRPDGGSDPAAHQSRQGVIGRVTAVNHAKKEFVVLARHSGEKIVVDASRAVKILRSAPDSLRTRDAVAASFAELRVGDQIRARGERSGDGRRFVPEEIFFGTFARVGGTVKSIAAPAANELTIETGPDGKTLIVSIGPRSALRRVTPDLAQTLTSPPGRAATAGAGPPTTGGDARSEGRRPEGAREGTPPRGGGRRLQEMIDGLPVITLTDLKKGDAVFVTGTTTGGEAGTSRVVTAILLLTGDEDFIAGLRQQQEAAEGGDEQNMSPGLPGDVLGGGTGGTTERERP